MPLVPKGSLGHEKQSTQSASTSLDHPEPDVRRQAARRTVDALPLAERLRRESDPAVLEALVTTLGSIGGAAAVAALVESIRSEDPHLRNLATAELVHHPDELGAWVPALLADADPDVRLLTAGLLGGLPHPSTERWLCDALATELDVNVCAAAVESLAMVGTAACRGALARVADRFAGEPFVRFAVDLALRQVGP